MFSKFGKLGNKDLITPLQQNEKKARGWRRKMLLDGEELQNQLTQTEQVRYALEVAALGANAAVK